MNTSGEAADQVVRMSLEVGEAALKISGEGAKQLAVLLYAVLQDQSKSMAKSKGKTRLESLVRTGKPLKVFSVKESDLKRFAKEAKRYGILYCAIRNPKENTDGMVDIMVKEEDAPRINRIVERFKLSAVEEKAIVETETETEVDKTEEKAEAEKEEAKKQEAEKPEAEKTKEEGKEQEEQNPSMAKTEKSHPSEPTSKKRSKADEGTVKKTEKPSVREELRAIKEKRQKSESEKSKETERTSKKNTRNYAEHRNPGKKKSKSKGR